MALKPKLSFAWRPAVLAWALAAAPNCWPQTIVNITAHPESPGVSIPNNFVGLSFETGSLTSSTGFPATNPVFRQMVSQIGPGVARFGGNSVDQLAGWVRGQRTSSTPTSVLTSSDVDPVFAWARAVDWRVLFSVNLGKGDPTSDADEANYVYGTASDVLLGLEIGNEPDLYHSNGLRPSTYTESDYLSEWQTFANAIQAETPAAQLTGPAAAGSITTWTSSFAQQEGSRIILLTQHLYPLAPTSVNPNASNAASIPNLLSSSIRTTEDNDGAELQQIASSAKIPWRMAETNSCYDGGQSGVSDVFASALWAADYMFTLANRSSAGVNFHGGGTGTYTPIAVSGSTITARPLYYALLLFHAAARGRMVPVDVSAAGINVTSYGALDADGTLRVLVVNKDQTQNAAVTITPGGSYTTALAMPLTGPTLSSTSGIALGGAAIALDGTWLPAHLAGAALASGAYTASVPAGSALLVSFGNGAMAVENAAGGQPQIAPASLASAYGQALGMAAASPAAPTPNLAGIAATITDAAGVTQPLSLTYAGTSQVNFLVPSNAATGTARVTIGAVSGTVAVGGTSPGLFELSSDGTAAALAVRVPNGQTSQTAVPTFDCSGGTCNSVPIAIDNQSTVYVSLYATGIRGATSVTCTVGGVPVPVVYAGPQSLYPGLDQVNISIPASLAGSGAVKAIVNAGGQASNPVLLTLGG